MFQLWNFVSPIPLGLEPYFLLHMESFDVSEFQISFLIIIIFRFGYFRKEIVSLALVIKKSMQISDQMDALYFSDVLLRKQNVDVFMLVGLKE